MICADVWSLVEEMLAIFIRVVASVSLILCCSPPLLSALLGITTMMLLAVHLPSTIIRLCRRPDNRTRRESKTIGHGSCNAFLSGHQCYSTFSPASPWESFPRAFPHGCAQTLALGAPANGAALAQRCELSDSVIAIITYYWPTRDWCVLYVNEGLLGRLFTSLHIYTMRFLDISPPWTPQIVTIFVH